MEELQRGVLFSGVAAVLAIAVAGFQLGASHTSTPPMVAAASAPAAPSFVLNQKMDRGELSQLAMFSEARAALARDDIAVGARIANQIPPSLKRSLVFIAIASRQSALGDAGGARRSLRSALCEKGQFTPAERMRLLAMIARVYLSFDPRAGHKVLQRAVMDYRTAANAGGHEAIEGAPGVRFTRGGFYEVVQDPSGYAQVFSLHLPGLPAIELDELALNYLPVR